MTTELKSITLEEVNKMVANDLKWNFYILNPLRREFVLYEKRRESILDGENCYLWNNLYLIKSEEEEIALSQLASRNLEIFKVEGLGIPDVPVENFDETAEVEVKIEICATLSDGEEEEKFFPKKAHVGDAAFDLIAANENTIFIEPLGTALVPTGFKMELPFGWEAQIRPRSGNALKKKIQIANSPGTIDSNYRGEVGVIVFNANKFETLTIERGDKIAQMVISKIPKVMLTRTSNLSDSERGSNGFGSTDKKES